MKHKLILSLLVVIASSLMLSACRKLPGQQQSDSTQDQQQDHKQAGQSGGFTGTIKNLISLGEAQKCTWVVEGQGASEVYTDGEKSRVETTTPHGQMIMINDAEAIYSWDPQTKKGMKMMPEDMKSEEAMIDEEEAMKVIPEEEIDYEQVTTREYEFSCESWSVNPTMFTPPTDIEFTDMNAMVEQMQQALPQGIKEVVEAQE